MPHLPWRREHAGHQRGGRDLHVITLILLAQLGFSVATLSIGYIRAWITLHINTRIDISLIADFLVKLTAMPQPLVIKVDGSKKEGVIMAE